jgi:sulfur relay (sulfurtransferase) DsrC/TusE family protein
MIKIVNGKMGFILKVNGMYIHCGFTKEIKAIANENGIPYGATEWASIQAVREFWSNYKPLIIASTKRPYKSVWGNLELF